MKFLLSDSCLVHVCSCYTISFHKIVANITYIQSNSHSYLQFLTITFQFHYTSIDCTPGFHTEL